LAQRTFDAEILQWRYARYVAFGFVVSLAVVIALVKTSYILAPAIVFIFGVTGYCIWRLYKMTDIQPYVMTAEELES
jgi:uncharacterized membrane protein YqjE